MIKRFAGLALMIILIGTGAASGQQDARAREVLDGLSEVMTKSPSVKVDFTISLSSMKDEVIDEFDGQITLKGEKYRLSIMETEIWFDGESMFTYMPAVNEVMISDADEEGGIISNPTEIFNIYPEEFRYRFIGEQTRSGIRMYEIDLHPLDRDQDFHTVKLFINRSTNFIHSAVIAGKDGNRYTLTVNSFNNREQVPDSFFVFDESRYPGVEIIDMRW